MSWHGFILFEVYLASCFYKFVSFTKFGKFSAMILSKTFSAPLSSSPRWQSLCLGLICWFGLTFVGCGSKDRLINQMLYSAILVCREYLVPLGLSLVLAVAAFSGQKESHQIALSGWQQDGDMMGFLLSVPTHPSLPHPLPIPGCLWVGEESFGLMGTKILPRSIFWLLYLFVEKRNLKPGKKENASPGPLPVVLGFTYVVRGDLVGSGGRMNLPGLPSTVKLGGWEMPGLGSLPMLGVGKQDALPLYCYSSLKVPKQLVFFLLPLFRVLLWLFLAPFPGLHLA